MEALTIIISMIVMFLWLRTEANADRRSINEVQREDRKDFLIMIGAIRDDVRAIKDDVRAIQEEVRDFHGRMCAIEERNKGK